MSSSSQPVPPNSSSHTAEPIEQSIHISKLGLLAVGLLAICLSPIILTNPALLSVLLVIPIVVAWWMLRVRTTVTADGLRLRRMFSSEHIEWSQIKGFRFPKQGWARADLTDGREVSLPVVTFGRLPQIAAASGGRVTDPYAAADRAAREKAAAERAAAENDETESGTESDPGTK
ncbi:PH domain-containing protein [Rhodococcus maanshanensis]|uniref:PH domain-containing protein n=1 Tax=Rhodococcus maanshanensis TaxID=183556 RepID=A0A1H7FKJ7_9NOCA|nr:PH domain-containing protein [Rhodococcus maanshanensis]SEK23845.1 PH domain-containing protein [Rhodococcus maanshanensis]